MKGFWLLLLLFLCNSVFSQDSTFLKVNSVVDTLPKTYTSSYKILARKLCDSLKNDEEKAKAIALWIIRNVEYDVKMYEKGRFKKQKSDEVLKKKKAICEGYSNLFKDMCNYVGIRAYVVTGYSKAGNYEPGDIFVREDHAWNALNINGKWYLVDLTWAAGNIELKPRMFRRMLSVYLGFPFKEKRKFVEKENYKYLFADPTFLIKDHLPVNQWWQLMSRTVPVDVFEKDSSEISKYIKEGKGNLCSFDADISKYEEMEEPQRILEKTKKAHQFNPQNFQTPAEGKIVHALQVFRETYVKNMKESDKLIIYDSCLIEIQGCINDLDNYDKITIKERDVRIKKNEKYSAETLKSMDNLSKLNSKRVKSISSQISAIRSELIKLEQEQNALIEETKKINEKTAPQASQKNQIKKIPGILKKIAATEEKVTFFSDKLNSEKDNNNIENYNSISNSEVKLAQLLTKTVFQKTVYRNFFHWHLKYYLDSLEKQEKALAISNDSVVLIINKNYLANASKSKTISAINTSLKKNINSTFDLYKKLYESANDSMISANGYQQKYEDLKTMQINLNQQKIKEIERKKEILENELKNFESILKNLEKYDEWSAKERKAEGVRVKKCKAFYNEFCERELQRSAISKDKIKKLKSGIEKYQEQLKANNK